MLQSKDALHIQISENTTSVTLAQHPTVWWGFPVHLTLCCVQEAHDPLNEKGSWQADETVGEGKTGTNLKG